MAVKGQVIGPSRWRGSSLLKACPSITQPSVPGRDRAVPGRLAQWQIDRLAQWGKPVLFFVDEPCLALVPSPSETTQEALVAVLHDLLAALRRPGVLLGVHTCARLSPGGVAIAALGQARPDIISFDAYQGLEVFCADPAAQDFLRTGGWVAWGLVPTWPRLDQLDPQALFARWLGAATGVMAVEAVARQTLITATCGLGLLPEPAVASSFHLAHQLAQRIAQVAQATA